MDVNAAITAASDIVQDKIADGHDRAVVQDALVTLEVATREGYERELARVRTDYLSAIERAEAAEQEAATLRELLLRVLSANTFDEIPWHEVEAASASFEDLERARAAVGEG